MNPLSTRPLRISLILIILLLPSMLAEAGGSGWWVNTIDDMDDGTCDDAHCSLREAINIANLTAGQQIIAFEIPGSGPHNIELCSALPAITDAVLIDGTLEPDYPFNGGPVIAITPGQGCSAPPYGLWFDTGNNVVRGIGIAGFDQPAAPISGGIILHTGNGSLIENNYIGLLPGGTPWGNRNGILLGSESHVISENIISGNTYGIHAFMGGHTIDQNHIGTDPDATSTSLALRNTIGVYIESGADNNTIGLSGTGNVISGNGNGIYLSSQGNTILGNKIGTDRTGTIALGNSIGTHASQATYTVIGGTDPGETNLISGNITGISLGGYSTVWGNFIGTDFSGSAAIPNQTGISIQSASYDLIGGTGAGQSNLISGNSNAGIIIHDAATHIEVVRNKIGTDITGSGPLGNGRGIFIQGNDNFIGHIATAGGNTIAYNGDEGVLLAWSASHNLIEVNTIHDNGVGVYAMDDTTSANPFTQNLIYGNASLGLDLAPMGVNLNDPGDADTGANQRLNYPEFTSTSTTVAEGTTCHGCTVEVFRSDTDPSNHGEGETLLGSVVAGPFGDFSLTYASSLATCDRITATTTDVFGNTSEFSPNRAVGLCLTIDPSWFFLVEITIFIIIWFTVLVIRRRGGRPFGGAAAAGGAAGLVAALGAAGLMYALPNVELNFPRGGPPAQLPAVLPACERFLVPGSMIPFEGARSMPIDPLADDGEHGMPIDRTIPVDQLESYGFFWGPQIEPHDDDGEHGDGLVNPLADDGQHGDGLVNPLADDGQHGDGLVNPLADDGQHGDGLVNPLADDGQHGDGLVMDDGEHGLPIDPYGHLTLSWDPFDQEIMPIDPLKDDGEHGDGRVMDDGQHGDGLVNPLADDGQHGDGLVNPLADDGQHGDGLVNPLADDGEHDDGLVMDDGEHGMPVDLYDQNAGIVWQVELVGPAGVAMSMVTTGNSIPLSAFGINSEKLRVDEQDYDSEPLALNSVPGESMDFLGYEGIDGESVNSLMIDENDYDFEQFHWRLTGLLNSGDGALNPFCRSTNWMAFQLGGFSPMLALPWNEAAPPPPAPAPLPPEPTPVVTQEAPVSCVPTFTATMNLTCRFGPDSAYKELGYLLQGESATIEGRNTNNTWWYIPNPDWQGNCWGWDGGGDAICIPEDLTLVAAPPLPPPTPTPLACRSDLGQSDCAAAGGTYSSGATTAPTCTCP
jgi:CSLREA domain-containing protein